MSDITLHDAACEYLEHLRSQGKSASTIYTYTNDFDQIETFFGEKKNLRSILIPHVAQFLKSDILMKFPGGRRRSEPTVKKTVRVFRMFMVWALGKGYIDRLPFPKGFPMGASKAEMQDDDCNGAD
jgi:hypothetical protein